MSKNISFRVSQIQNFYTKSVPKFYIPVCLLQFQPSNPGTHPRQQKTVCKKYFPFQISVVSSSKNLINTIFILSVFDKIPIIFLSNIFFVTTNAIQRIVFSEDRETFLFQYEKNSFYLQSFQLPVK